MLIFIWFCKWLILLGFEEANYMVLWKLRIAKQYIYVKNNLKNWNEIMWSRWCKTIYSSFSFPFIKNWMVPHFTHPYSQPIQDTKWYFGFESFHEEYFLNLWWWEEIEETEKTEELKVPNCRKRSLETFKIRTKRSSKKKHFFKDRNQEKQKQNAFVLIKKKQKKKKKKKNYWSLLLYR